MIALVDAVEESSCPYPAWNPPAKVPLTVFPEHPCSYLPERAATTRGFWAERVAPEIYHAFMDAGFRRSGRLIYQPICGGCRACLPIRVPLETFTPSKSQRRCYRRNADLVVTVAAPAVSDEKWELYQRYMKGWHRGQADDRESFAAFLYDSPVDTLEFAYREPGGRLLAVGICDISRTSISSVYFYFDPADAARSLGTFSALYELNYARDREIPYYYLGYWIDRCRTMRYKSTYRLHQILHPDNIWRPGTSE